MAIRITNEETCRLAAELAELTGETTTGAITVALRERLEREELTRELLAIGRRTAAIARERDPTITAGEEISLAHGDYLYDEHGAPRGSGDFALTDITPALPPTEAG